MAKIVKAKSPIQFAKSMLDYVIEKTESPTWPSNSDNKDGETTKPKKLKKAAKK